MVDNTLTHIYPVLDRSGSMRPHVQATCEGFDSFIAEQRQLPGRCYVTLAQFDNQYEVVYTHRDIRDVPPLALRPRGSTALLDAIGHTIAAAGDELSALPEDKRPGSVIIPILTDGFENASHEYNVNSIRDMIREQTEKYSWLFTFIGANQDAILVAESMGMSAANSMTYDTANTVSAFNSLSASNAAYRRARAGGQSFAAASKAAAYTDSQRSDALQGTTSTSR